MTMMTETKAVRLARFLREYVQSRSTLVRTLDSYEAVLWFHDVPIGDGCSSMAHAAAPEEDDEAQVGVWLEARDQDLPDPPAPPTELVPWLDPTGCDEVERIVPRLLSIAVIPDTEWRGGDGEEPPQVSARLEEHPGIKGLYEGHVRDWARWEEAQREKIRAKRLYKQLFDIHTQLQRDGEQVELCLGLGLLDWPTPGKKGVRVRRHVVTASVNLRFLPRQGRIRIECPEEGAKVRLEDDMLEPELQPDKVPYAEVREQLDGIQKEDAIWDRTRILPALQTWGRALHAETRWSPELAPLEGEGERPAISWAPALILRRRGQIAMLRVYDQLIEQLSELPDGQEPPGWRGLLADEDDRVTSDGQHAKGAGDHEVPVGSAWDDWDDIKEEIFFPLPANRQQLEIVDTVRKRRGVLVQGPPGTGKSHTIANLLCHLLASGQRVLVTAETPRALAVLRDKLPEEIRALCISVLGSGGESYAELSGAVQKISTRWAHWSMGESQEVAERHCRELAQLRSERDKVLRELRDIRFAETRNHEPAPGYSGSPEAIARKVSALRPEFEWLLLSDEDPEGPALSNAEAVRWLELTRQHDGEAVRAARRELPPLKGLPTAREVGDLLVRIQGQEDRLRSLAERSHPAFSALARLTTEELEQLRKAVRELRDSWRAAPNSAWCSEVAAAVREGRAGEWFPLLERTSKAIAKIRVIEEDLAGRDVRLPLGREPARLRADAHVVLEHLERGGKWRAFAGLMRPAAVKGREYLLDEVTVDASAPDEPEELRAVALAASRQLEMDDVEVLWSAHDPGRNGEDAATRISRLQTRYKQLDSLLKLGCADRELRQRVEGLTNQTVPTNWLTAGTVDWLRTLEVALLEVERRGGQRELDELAQRLNRIARMHDAHAASAAARSALEKLDTAGYGRARLEIEAAWSLRALDDERERLDREFMRVQPDLRGRILEDLQGAAWRERLATLDRAWAWARSDHWLKRFGDPGRVVQLEGQRRTLEECIGKSLTELAAEYAWQKFFARLTTPQANALKSWRDAVKMMGKGKGRSAKLERLRRLARQYMDACRDVIPAWIMPRYLVAEMIDPHPGRFDTVIIDEASQMGIGGLFVNYIGKRLVVVGDDQQISPSDIGVEDEAIEALRRKYIPDIDHAQALMPGGSVYQNASIRFGRSVTLREHFRCMPEIIQFSNDLCYAANHTPLDPLRSYAGDRLEPLKVRHVLGGQRTGDSSFARNDVEARMIVDQIEACLADPQYDGKTFGVISLQGKAQARLIESMLLARLDADVFEERRILCGDSYTFQGDERHVVFLSMVASRGETRLSAITAQSYVQRFNVAVSRAQDQLWLFHSVEPQDLKPECLRYRLIQYMRNPQREVLSAEGQRFDSPFEEDVFSELSQRGYRVQTQVAVGDARTHSYRIDLVVEGLAGKLAVECDGDRWHGPDRWEADQARQRDLERVGWQLVRILGSSFYRNRQEALKPLWAELDRRRILPTAVESPRPCQQGHASDADERAAMVKVLPAAPEEPSADTLSANGVFATQAITADGSGSSAKRTQPEFCEAGTSASSLTCEPSVPDPRVASRVEVYKALSELIRLYGPLPRDAVIRRYVRAAGLGRTGRVLREALDEVLQSGVRRGEFVLTRELGSRSEGLIVRLRDTPQVVLRPRGDREFEEIPPSEWAELMRSAGMCSSVKDAGEIERIFRTVLEQLAFSSLTVGRRQLLEAAADLARSPSEAA